jgi:DNA topoisomerase-1
MSKNLVIVESPAKAKTIEKFLGKDYKVMSSFGHIRDLAKGDAGIDIENGFNPRYQVPDDKKKIVQDLQKLAKKAETVWLASDEDREGEAISWHLYEVLGLTPSNTKRIVFNEITKSAIEKAVQNPRTIDKNLVDAQQARRVLDRLVGYELSPVLWRKIKPSLSAGRVQSVAVRLIVERERDIKEHTSSTDYRITAQFLKDGHNFTIKASTTPFKEAQETEDFLNACIQSSFSVNNLTVKDTLRKPTAPFTTSTLQQEASRKLGYSVSKTMMLAQKLYEAGHITYMRTDSVNLSTLALNAAKEEITKEFGAEYSTTRTFKNKNSSAQEAHEAIRPAYFDRKNAGNDGQEQRLYELIWKRTLASQMSDAKLEKTSVDISISKSDKTFKANGEVIKFSGFLKLYLESSDDEDEEDGEEGILPPLKIGEVLQLKDLDARERFTRPAPRYTEATLVKKLEELGIGRPSTYAPTISTIQKREYVVKETREGKERQFIQFSYDNNSITKDTRTEIVGGDKNKLFPTDIGTIVTDFLVEHFGTVMDYNFTASVEKEFDDIASGLKSWSKMIDSFYHPFHKTVENTMEVAERASGSRELGIDPESGKPVIARIGRFGAMVQIGSVEDEDKPKFAGLQKDQSIETITFEEAMQLFALPKELGEYKGLEVLVGIGRFGPYVKYDEKFISIERGVDPLSLSKDDAIELIKQKEIADAPIYEYENLPVQKGTGRFGPFIKWNNMFINVNKKYDFENLTDKDIVQLIEDKKQKEIDKVIHNWKEEGIRVEKARWGRSNIIKGKTKVELPKTVDATKLTLAEAIKKIEAATPKKKAKKKTTAKAKAKK